MRHKGRQNRSILTVNGRVKLSRIRWSSRCNGNGPSEVCTPLDAFLDAADKTFTRGVREMLCRLNQSSPSFVKTAENIGRLAALSVSGETARQIIEEEGRRVVESMQAGRLDLGWSAKDCKVPDNPEKTRVYQGCDGVKVPVITDEEKRKRRATMKDKRRRGGKKCRPLPALKAGADQSFKEVRVVTAYDESQQRRAVVVTRGDCNGAGRLVRSLNVRLKTAQADETIANIDGAPWIRNQYELHHAAQAINVDYYHVKDYAQRTRREVFGEGTAAGETWLQQFLTTVLERGVEDGVNDLLEWRRSLRGRKRTAATRFIGYLSERRDIIRYPEFRAKGWQIGSGPTEAQCKTTTQRIKGRGRRWDLKNAEALMALAALEASELWPSWSFSA